MENNKTNKTTISSIITAPFYIEELQVDPLQNMIVRDGQAIETQPKLIDVLCFLCSHALSKL